MQELAKAGLSHRAAELFDWMRRLPDGHELASLCDVYTYTTGKHISLVTGLAAAECICRSSILPCNKPRGAWHQTP